MIAVSGKINIEIGISEDRCDWGQSFKLCRNVRRADITGVENVIDVGEYLRDLVIKVPVFIRDDAPE
ncbi:MAG: hypothetical protein M2R45_00913 [Verrucomicrobia subdivision 3 bacterium]|nr:hypothetical protein [Limisphaerales bacterium]MCS1414582.1 hypothetical protein [Limisphaerales bacterium]